MHAAKKLLMLSAMKKPRNAISVMMVMMDATPPLSAPPPVESHTPSATQVPENAQPVLQVRPTHHALKFKTLVMPSAPSNPCQSATQKESAINARLMETDASQPAAAKLLANHTHQRTPSTNVNGTEPSHSVLLTKMLPRARPSVSKNALNQNSLNATIRTTLVLNANKVRTKIAFTLPTTARSPKKKANAHNRNWMVFSE